MFPLKNLACRGLIHLGLVILFMSVNYAIIDSGKGLAPSYYLHQQHQLDTWEQNLVELTSKYKNVF